MTIEVCKLCRAQNGFGIKPQTKCKAWSEPKRDIAVSHLSSIQPIIATQCAVITEAISSSYIPLKVTNHATAIMFTSSTAAFGKALAEKFFRIYGCHGARKPTVTPSRRQT
jgi:hypothetical protein